MDEHLTTSPYIPTSSLLYEGAKRGFDIVVGSCLLLGLSPVLLAAALAVRLTSKGSAIYKQARVGQHDCEFKVWKFRTMSCNADQWGPLITASDDVRVTRVGKFLRHYKIDELPQLWNVVKGEMSLVGPRPQVPRFVKAFPAEKRAIILTVRPGITGPTQLAFRNEEQRLEGQEDRESYYIEHLLPTKCRMDVEYVQQRSMLLDISVLFKTLLVLAHSEDRCTLPDGEKTISEQVSIEGMSEHFPRHGSYCGKDSYRDDKEEEAKEEAAVGMK